MRTLVGASLRQHGRRYAAAAIAIVLGVGFLSAAIAVTAAAKKGVGDALVVQYSAADVIVRATSTDVRRSDLRLVLDQQGIGASTVADAAWFSTRWPRSVQPSEVQVGEVATDARLRWQRLESGRFPESADEVVVDGALAEEHGLEVGDVIELRRTDGRSLSGAMVGVTEPIEAGAYAARIFTIDRPVRAWGIDDRMPPELLLTAAGVDPEELAGTIEALGLPAEVQTTDEARTQVRSSLTDDLDLLGLMLTAYAAVALFVSALVIANTFTIVVAQRSRDLALLRCVGGSRRQLLGSLLAEAVVLGLVTAAVGTAAGIGFAAALVTVLNHTALPFPMALAAPTMAGIVVPFVVGVVLTVVAGLGPAIRSRSISPLAALRADAGPGGRVSVGVARVVLGVLLAVGGLGLLGLGISRSSLVYGIAGGATAFLAVLAWAPVLAPAAVRVIDGVRRIVPRRFRGGVPTELAIANSVRHPRRTASTVSALLVGVTLISMLSVGASSLSASAGSAIDHNNPVDLTVTADDGLDEDLIDAVTSVSGVDAVAPLTGTRLRIGGSDVAVGGISSTELDVVGYLPLRSELAAGRAVVPLERSELLRGRAEGTLRVITDHGVVEVPAVLAPTGPGPVVMPAELVAELSGQGEPRPWALWLRISSDTDPSSLMGDLRGVVRASEDPSAAVTGGYVERSVLDRALDVMLLVASGLLGLAVVIALVGVGNTLSLSVLERAREHALLRALGLTRGQQRLMLAAEAAVVAIVATVGGIALGVGFGWAATTTVLGKVTDQATVLDVPWLRLAFIAAIALSAGVVASVLPARRAARISPAAGLADG